MAASPRAAIDDWRDLSSDTQRPFLQAVFEEDQASETLHRGAFLRGGTALPASAWRWLDYGWVGNPDAPLGNIQQRLQQTKARNQGAGAVIAALERRGLIETRRSGGGFGDDSYQLKIKLTVRGRAAAKAGGLALGKPGKPGRGMLSEPVWAMLVDVCRAGPAGLARRYADGAWDRLTRREPAPFVAVDRDAWKTEGKVRLHLTEAGRTHYTTLWEEYARVYPRVDAPSPDGSRQWPEEADRLLAVLRQEAVETQAWIVDAAKTREALTIGVHPLEREVPDGVSRDLQRAVAWRRKRAEVCQRVAERALAAHREELDGHLRILEELYRQAAVRYCAAVCAAIDAAAAGADPVPGMRRAADGPAGWPWQPPLPVTGADPVDSAIERAYTARGWKSPSRRRRAPASELPPMEQAARVVGYANDLTNLVEGGYLCRLLPRKDHHPA